MARFKLGELLVKANVLSEAQLKLALGEQQRWGGRLGEILARMNLVAEDTLVRALGRQLAVPVANLGAVQGVPPEVRAKLPEETARVLNALPLQLLDGGKTLVVAMADPQNIGHVDTLRAVCRCRLAVHIAGRLAIARAHGRIYGGEDDVSDYEGSFKLLDAQGQTMVRDGGGAKRKRSSGSTSGDNSKSVRLSDVQRAKDSPLAPAAALALLESVEESQRREVAALKAMVELLIQKGVFTRDEYLAKVRR